MRQSELYGDIQSWWRHQINTTIGRVVRLREGHQAVIYIITALETQDEKWLEKALESLSGPIEYINAKNL